MKKILIAEDDKLSRQLLAESLERSGYTAIQCSNGRRAWETLSDNHDIVLLVTDMAMPDMDGRQLVQAIRGNQKFASLPVILISGVVGLSDVASLLELGSTRFLPKPVTLNDLEDCVASFLRGS